MRIFRNEFQVRGYELDGFGHVNHAVYLNYAEFARWRMIEEAGDGPDYFKRQGVAPVIARAEITYKEPCFLSEWLVMETTLLECRSRSARFRHLLLKRDSRRVAAEIIVTAVTVDASGKAVVLPADFKERFGGPS